MAELSKVALVGRPNVGKSTLFNRLIGKRQAVVADVAGTTRDRLEGVVEWNGQAFTLIDMAGIEPALSQKTEMSQAMQLQVQKSIQMADILIWVVDSSQDIRRVDEQVATLLRDRRKPIIVAVNKSDNREHDLRQYEFARFGFESLIALSAIHGRGINELLDAIIERLPTKIAPLPPQERELRLAIAGRPNVGKSTLINALSKEVRAVVSPVAGTTRDSVDNVVPAEQIFDRAFTQWKTVRIIDTAGMRRPGSIEQGIETWSIIRTLDAVDAAEVVLFLIDAEEGLVHQDLKVVQKIVDSGKAFILLINKWDSVLAAKKVIWGTDEDMQLQEKVLDQLRLQAPFLYWAQVLFLSAAKDFNINIIGRLIINAYKAWSFQVDQSELDDLTKELRKTPRLRNLQKITLEHNQPPVFHIHVEGKELPHFSTHRYLENTIRDYFELGPTPIKIWSVPSVQRNKR